MAKRRKRRRTRKRKKTNILKTVKLHHESRGESTPEAAFSHLWFATLVGAGLIFGFTIILQLPYVNGCCAWIWGWHRPALATPYIYLCIPLTIVLYGFAKVDSKSLEHNRPFILVIFFVATFLFQILGIYAEGGDLDKMRRIIISPIATSYFTDAENIINLPQWLPIFHRNYQEKSKERGQLWV